MKTLTAILLCLASADATTFPAAETAAEKVAQAETLLETPHFERGFSLAEAALAQLEKETAATPNDAQAHSLRARALLLLAKDEQALAAIDRALKLKPKEAEYHRLRSRILRYLEKLDEAAASLREAVKLQPAEPRYHFKLGVVLDQLGKSDEALAQVRKAAALNPKYAEPLIFLGAEQMKAGKTAEGLETFRIAAKVDASCELAWANIGQVLQNQGRLAEAVRAYQKVLSLNPNRWRARAKLIQLHQGLGQLTQRDKHRAALLKQRSESPTLSLKRADFYCREQFKVAKRPVYVYEHFELKGDRAIRYAFLICKPESEDVDYRISLGSYEFTNAAAREAGDLKPGERLFHLDEYRPGMHATLDMRKGEPAYDEVRKQVIRRLGGKLDAMSATITGVGSRPAPPKAE